MHHTCLAPRQHKISEMSVKLDAARLLTWKAAVARDRGENYTKEAAMAKLFASEAATFCSHAVRVQTRNTCRLKELSASSVACIPFEYSWHQRCVQRCVRYHRSLLEVEVTGCLEVFACHYPIVPLSRSNLASCTKYQLCRLLKGL